mmetsp:Transcript_4474/g.10860  ORF Transcript_4474/g.10860 Transcript_4474/m.10860 type:complete len:88 (+) Transcript_4474:457-720(+)
MKNALTELYCDPPSPMLEDRDVAMAAVTRCDIFLKYSGSTVRLDNEVVAAEGNHDGLALLVVHADETLKIGKLMQSCFSPAIPPIEK